MRRGRWRESEHWNDWYWGMDWRDGWEWRKRHEVKDGDRDNRWGWIGWDRGSERLRDVSVTADCADIDPSLALCPQETESQRETRGLRHTQRDCEVIAERRRKERQKERKRSDCLSPLVSSVVFYRAHCTVCTDSGGGQHTHTHPLGWLHFTLLVNSRSRLYRPCVRCHYSWHWVYKYLHPCIWIHVVNVCGLIVCNIIELFH